MILKKYFYNYVKLIYLLYDENYEQIKNENLVNQLNQKINSKGYQNIKDYLYFIYIQNMKENKNFENIDKINDILKEVPDLLILNINLDMINLFYILVFYLKI